MYKIDNMSEELKFSPFVIFLPFFVMITVSISFESAFVIPLASPTVNSLFPDAFTISPLLFSANP